MFYDYLLQPGLKKNNVCRNCLIIFDFNNITAKRNLITYLSNYFFKNPLLTQHECFVVELRFLPPSCSRCHCCSVHRSCHQQRLLFFRVLTLKCTDFSIIKKQYAIKPGCSETTRHSAELISLSERARFLQNKHKREIKTKSKQKYSYEIFECFFQCSNAKHKQQWQYTRQWIEIRNARYL